MLPVSNALSRARRKPTEVNGHIDRLPPYSQEAEQGVLGCCLLSPRNVVAEVITRFKGDVEVMYDLRHQTILTALFRMAENNYEIDIITLQQRLSDLGELAGIGGIAYLNSLQDAVPSAANLSYYCDIVLEKFLLRRAIVACTECIGRVYEEGRDVNEIMDEIESAVLQIRSGFQQSGSVAIKSIIPEAIAEIEASMKQDRAVIGIETGFPDLDKMTTGLQAGDMIVIAARPSLGKTSLAMNIADFIAVSSYIPVGVFSLEMTKKALTKRMMSSRARVNLRNLQEGYATELDIPKLTTASSQIAAAPLWIDDTPSLSIMELRARARTMVQQHGIKVFIIDYLQLLHSTTKRAQDNRQQEITEISSGIKSLAKELNVAVIVLSQLNREIERVKRRPMLSDLRESGSIEQDADLVAFLYKPNYDDDEEAHDGVLTNLLIAKQRNGPTGTIPFTFLKNYTRFEPAAKITEDDLP